MAGRPGRSGSGGARRGAGRPKGAKTGKTRKRRPPRRAKRALLLAEITALAQSYGPAAIATLGEIMVNPLAPDTARATCAFGLLDRGYGKPTQPHEHRFDPAKLTDEEIAYLISVEERLAGLERAAGGASAPLVIEGQLADRPEPGSEPEPVPEA